MATEKALTEQSSEAGSGKGRLIGYWVLTAAVVLSQGASGAMDLIGAAPIVEAITTLGYPAYVLWILGPAKLAGAVVLALPGLRRLKEWAYAGFVIDFGGAFASHLFHGDGPKLLAPPLILLAVLLGSYFLRPEARRLPDAAAA